MIKSDQARFSAITESGLIRSNFAYNGTYAYIFTFGCATIYIYYSPRSNTPYKIYTRSYFPSDRIPIKISLQRGFLFYETSDFSQAVIAYKTLILRFFHDFKDSFDNLKPIFSNESQLLFFEENSKTNAMSLFKDSRKSDNS